MLFRSQTPFSGGFRIRHNINSNSKSVQFRLQPANVKLPISKKTNFYATPYEAVKYNYSTKQAKFSTGAFAGLSTKIGKTNVFIEGQLYDVTKIDKPGEFFAVTVKEAEEERRQKELKSILQVIAKIHGAKVR